MHWLRGVDVPMRSRCRRLLNGLAVRGGLIEAEQYARMLVRPYFRRPHPDPSPPSGGSGLRRHHADRPALVLTDRRTLDGTRCHDTAAAGEENDDRQEQHRARRRHAARRRRHRSFVVLTLYLVSGHCPVTERTASAGCLALAHSRPAGVRHVVPRQSTPYARDTTSHPHTSTPPSGMARAALTTDCFEIIRRSA
jgi:hypothetical protein